MARFSTKNHPTQKTHTLQGTNISHLGKRKIIFKSDFCRDMLVPRRVSRQLWRKSHHSNAILLFCYLEVPAVAVRSVPSTLPLKTATFVA